MAHRRVALERMRPLSRKYDDLEHDEPKDCITSDLNCADVCTATMRVLSRQTAYHPAMTREMFGRRVESLRATS